MKYGGLFTGKDTSQSKGSRLSNADKNLPEIRMLMEKLKQTLRYNIEIQNNI